MRIILWLKPKKETAKDMFLIFRFMPHGRARQGRSKKRIGITRDISSSGTFMICSNLIDRECKIDFRVDLPVLVKDAAKSCILGRGKVVRKVSLANPDTGYGHGIMFDNYKILRLNSIIYQFGTKGGIENVT